MVRRACADATAGAGGDHQRIGRKVGERVLPPGIERSSRSKISRDFSVPIRYPVSVIPTLSSTVRLPVHWCT
jgi:hypothetical protein